MSDLISKVRRDRDLLLCENIRLRAALKPFADQVAEADTLRYAPPDSRFLMFASEGGGTFLPLLTFGDLRRLAELFQRRT